jgi:thiosulfate/3-mercaptopyruvate sulfurtransferase
MKKLKYNINVKAILGISGAIFLSACGGGSQNKEEVQQEESKPSIAELSPYIITVSEYESMIENAESYTLIDLRKEEDYKNGHIKGALQIWRDDIQEQDTAYGGLMAGKDQMIELLGELGVDSAETIVVYDNKANVDAMRLWWILQCYGHDQVIMIDGGLKSWVDAGLDLDTNQTAAPEISEFKFEKAEDWQMYASKQDVIAAQEQGALILDTRSKEEFEGVYIKDGAFRAGHIPGSVRIDYASNFYWGESETIRDLDELNYIYQELGEDKNRPIITYCHSGVRSAFSTFVLVELLGYTNVKNYDGSWTEWSFYEELPVQTIVE